MLKRILVGFGILLLLVAGIGQYLGSQNPGKQLTSSGLVRNQAIYVTTRDGTKLAIDVWLPLGHRPGDKIPTLMNLTRYVRSYEYTWLGRAMAGAGLLSWYPSNRVAPFNAAGYAVALVDARGTGASFGARTMELSPQEMDDFAQVVDWVVTQPWSNGKVGTFGASYEADTGELILATGRSAIKATFNEVGDFDTFRGLVFPGGARNNSFMKPWAAMVAELDANQLGPAFSAFAGSPIPLRWIYVGTKPVDLDHDRVQLKAAIAEHQNADVMALVSRVTGLDEVQSNGVALEATLPIQSKGKIEAGGAAYLVDVGWLDAGTTQGALWRYLTFSNPQVLEIHSRNHRGVLADPFRAGETAPDPVMRSSIHRQIAFFDRYLKAESPPADKMILYSTMNHGAALPPYRTTTTWPPAGLINRRFYFDAAGTLADLPPAVAGADRYEVDFSVTSGPTTRWNQMVSQGYSDRRALAPQLLTYTGPSLSRDVEITGSPTVDLCLASSATDGLFIPYLEAVAPDGRVVYLTEGVLQGRHRKAMRAPPVVSLGQYRSQTRADTAAMVPGKVDCLTIELLPLSVRLETGWRIRVSVAGADEGTFERVPASGPVTWMVSRGGATPSGLTLPIADR